MDSQMARTGAYGDQLGHYFGLDVVPSLVTASSSQSPFAVTRLSCNKHQLGFKQMFPAEDAFVVTLHLLKVPHLEIWQHKQLVSARSYMPGSISIVNLLDEIVIYVGAPLDCLSFYIPRRLFDEASDNIGGSRCHGISCPPGLEDRIIEQIGAALLPLLPTPRAVAPGFLEHIALATTIHVAYTYRDIRPTRRRALHNTPSSDLRDPLFSRIEPHKKPH
jgi:hypothetical protein